MKTTVVAHCQDAQDSKQQRNNSISGNGGEYANDSVQLILTKYIHNNNNNKRRSDSDVDSEEDDKLTRQGFNRSDFDIYLTHPTKED